MGGSTVPCTIDDFILFVKSYYPENKLVLTWLTNQKMKLGKPVPMDLNKPQHVLYLPASRFFQ